MRSLVVAKQFRGPPNSGNGGYVAGLLGREFAGPAAAIIRAPVPLDTELRLEERGAGLAVLAGETILIEGSPAPVTDLPEVPAPPSLAEARAAGARSPVLEKPIHPPCFCCSIIREEGDGLRVCNGQIEGAPAGYSACEWVPHASFADADGLIHTEIVWAALDCSGSIAWMIKGAPAGLLGTMVGEVVRRPRAGEPTIVMAWPLNIDGRKHYSGVALFSGDGELLARGRQIWIGRALPRGAG